MKNKPFMRSSRSVAVLFACVLFACVPAEKSLPTEAEMESHNQSLAEGFISAWNAGDAAALATQFHPEGRRVNSDVQEVWFGRQAIEDGFAMMLAADNPYGGSTLSAEVLSSKGLAPGLFIASGEWQLIDATGEQLRIGFFANTIVIEDGKAYLMQESAGEYTPPN